MRLHIIIPLTLLILLTGCGAKNKNLIETESELVQDQGASQIRIYNDVFEAYGKKSNYTYIDIIRDNEVKETINTYRYLDKVTNLDCFDFNDDGIKDIAVIGASGSETKVLLYESMPDYHYDVFSGWSDVGNDIRESIDDDFSMVILKNILDRVTNIEDAALEESSEPAKVLESEVTTFNSYDELIEDIKVMIEMKESNSDTFYHHAQYHEWFTSPIDWAFQNDSFGYLQVDIDGDGIDELLLGINDSEDDSHNVNVLSMFTIRDGKVDVVFESDYRRSFELYEDGIILDDWGIPNSFYSLNCYKYSAGGMEFIEGVNATPVFSEGRCQCYYYDSSLQEREISDDEYSEFYEELLHRYNKPKFQLHLFKE
ncbi:MAG: hypothetical protein IKP88_01145 [Lachnospiraceae bacterium]|nr:hypothetical protein [Lachnospiraceae bacterium]